MPIKGSGTPTAWEEIDRFEGGFGWIAHPEEAMQRASHALTIDGDVWLVDPVDADGIDELLAEHGDTRGVVVLLDRHKRDAEAIARRHDVSIWIPQFMDGLSDEFDAPVEQFRYELADTGYTAHEVVDNRFWREAMLYNDENGVLIVPEAVGTTEYATTDGESLGVHPVLRLKPPTSLSRLDPERILLGHGEGIHHDAAETLEAAVRGARSNTPALYWKNVRQLFSG
jgi:hypothetical protein